MVWCSGKCSDFNALVGRTTFQTTFDLAYFYYKIVVAGIFAVIYPFTFYPAIVEPKSSGKRKKGILGVLLMDNINQMLSDPCKSG